MSGSSDFSPLVSVHSSPIHGTGVFALQDLRAEARLLEYKGERISKAESARREESRNAAGAGAAGVRGGSARRPGTDAGASTASVFLFEMDEETDLDGDIPDNPAKFINHSCDENCEVILADGRLWVFAKRDIPAGTELTFDYAFPFASFFEHPCCCGAAGCPGYIVARHERTKLRRLLMRQSGLKEPYPIESGLQSRATPTPSATLQ